MFKVVAVAVLAFVAVAAAQSCGSAALQQCGQSFSQCLIAGKARCTCYGDYEACFKAAGCPNSVLAGVVKTCESQGCTEAQCGGPIVNNCNSTAIGACASNVSKCIQSNPTNLCGCEGDLVQCYEALDCGDAVVSSAKQACMDAGCSASQCSPSMSFLRYLAATEVASKVLAQ